MRSSPLDYSNAFETRPIDEAWQSFKPRGCLAAERKPHSLSATLKPDETAMIFACGAWFQLLPKPIAVDHGILAPASTKRKGHYRSSFRSGPRSATPPLFAAPLRRGQVFHGPINSDRLRRRWVQTNDEALYNQRPAFFAKESR